MNETASSLIAAPGFWLCLSTLFYFFVNGCQVYETFVIIPRWTASPPESLHYFTGKYAIRLKTFWTVLHTLHEITFMIAIVLCWKLGIRNALVILFAIHFAVRAWTIIYFARDLMLFERFANSEISMIDPHKRAARWRNLNYFRVGIFIAVSIALVPLCLEVLRPVIT